MLKNDSITATIVVPRGQRLLSVVKEGVKAWMGKVENRSGGVHSLA